MFQLPFGYPLLLKRLLLLLVGVLIFGANALAQQYNFQRYTVANGLPQSQVTSIFQDSSGYVWVGTEGGVTRFDGNVFEVFNGGVDLSGMQVTAITQTPQGVTIATDSCIAVFTQGRFREYTFPRNISFSRVNLFFTGAKQELLLGTDKGVWMFSGGKFTPILTGTPLDQLPVRAALLDSHNHLWVGTAQNGLFQLIPSKTSYTNQPFADQEKLLTARIRGLVEYKKGEIWIATSDRGLFNYDEHSLNQVVLPTSLGTLYFTSILCDHAGDLWMGTWGGGVISYKNGTFRQISKKNGLSDDIVTSLMSDLQGNIWLGTYQSGLVFFYGEMFVSYTTNDGLPDNNVRSLITDENGNVWMATLGGLAMFDGVDIRTWTTAQGLSYDRLGAVATDGHGRIFVGTMSGEINVIENTVGRPVVYRAPENERMGEVLSLLYTRDGSLWIGTVANGLFRFINNRIESINTGNVLIGNPIWSLYEDNEGGIWLGTGHGLFMFDKGYAVRPEQVSVKKQTALDQTVYDIDGDATYIYITTQRSGLWRYHRKKKKYQVLNTREGLGSNFTRGMQMQGEKVMYVATMLGMDRITFLDSGQLVQHYWLSDGIGTSNFSPNAMTTDLGGRIWMGSTDGVIVYSPFLSNRRNIRPRILLKDLLLFNLPVEDWSSYSDGLLYDGLPSRPVFPYNKSNLTFVFAGIQFGAGVNISYSYKLEGAEADWIKLTSGNSVMFQSLPPGDYVLHFKAMNSNGIASEVRTYPFRIRAPFWATGWFFLIIIGILLSVIYFFTRLYSSFRSTFVKDQQSLYHHQLSVARFVLLTAGVVYPLSVTMITVFAEEVILHLWLVYITGAFMIATGIASSFYSFFRNRALLIAQYAMAIVFLQLMYFNYINQLSPITVVSLIVAISCVGMVYDSIRSLLIISSVIISLSFILVMMNGASMLQYNGWMFMLAIVISFIVAFISVLTRQNLFNRLLFADATINNARSIVLAVDASGKVIFASRNITAILGFEQAEVMGDGWWKLRGGTDEEAARMRSEVLSNKHKNETYVVQVRTKNGGMRWIQWQDTEMEGNIKVGIGLDVTDRHEIEERYRHIVESATDIIYTADHLGNFTYSNDVAVKILGYPYDQLMGRHFTEFIHPEWVKEVMAFYNKQFQRRLLTTTLEFPVIRNDGGIVWLGQTVRILFQEEHPDRIRGFQAIARDITEKKQYEEELEKLSLVASETINGVLICDPESNIEWVNEGFTRITGYSLAEVRDRRSGDVLRGEKTNMATIYEARDRVSTGHGFEVELLVYHRDGKEMWISVTNTPIVDENGRLLKQIEIFTDITEKKIYESELEKLSLVASRTTNGVIICNAESRVEWVNEGFTRITGYTLEEVVNRRPGDLMSGDKTNLNTVEVIRKTAEGGHGFEGQVIAYAKSGEELWLAVNNTPILDANGSLLKQIEIFSDISENKRNELKLSQYSKNLEVLNDIRQRVLDAESVVAIAANVLPIFVNHSAYASRVLLGLADEQHELVELYFIQKGNLGKLEFQLIPSIEFNGMELLRSNKQIIVDEIIDKQFVSTFDKRLYEEGLRAYCVSSLTAEGKFVGFLSLCSDVSGSIETNGKELLEEAADVLGNAIQQLRYREIIQQKNEDIASSINYARRIQTAILPPEQFLREELGDVFVFYRPKDILCGDYYWVESRDNYTFVAVADSTGHGVPGALLSLMGHNLLNQAIRERRLTRPAAILDYLNAGIQQTLNQYKQAGELHDGMDISLCVFEKNSRKVMFAGAINPLYLVRDQGLQQVKGNRFSIGSYFDHKLRPFDHQEVELQEGDMLYLFTDGYPDQFGGDNDRKLSHRRFRELLVSISHLPPQQQRDALAIKLDSWMRSEHQTDDICVMGIRIH